MKRHLLILIFLIQTVNFVRGQTNIYHSFPDTNAIWSDDWNAGGQSHHKFGIHGDTVLNGVIYKKIYSLYDTTLTNPNSAYYAAIREQNKKVYTVIDNSNEIVLYDFNLLVGDTMTYYYSMMFTVEVDTFSRVVSKIDSIILLDGNYRKRYYLDGIGYCDVNDTIVEGIGSISWKGLFNPLEKGICTCGYSFHFSCFKQNDNALYMNNAICNWCFCELFTDVSDIADLGSFSFSSNPFTSQTTLYFSDNVNDATLIIYNTNGQKVKQVENISGQTIAIQRDNLASGLYFIRLTKNNKDFITGKLAITDN